MENIISRPVFFLAELTVLVYSLSFFFHIKRRKINSELVQPVELKRTYCFETFFDCSINCYIFLNGFAISFQIVTQIKTFTCKKSCSRNRKIISKSQSKLWLRFRTLEWICLQLRLKFLYVQKSLALFPLQLLAFGIICKYLYVNCL